MNIGRRDYAERKAARIARLEARAAGKAAEASHLFTKHDALLGVMAGTPVLRGHHSERRHRRDLDRIQRDTRKALDASKESEALARRASAAAANAAISSDDPDALPKLRAKLDNLESSQAKMKQANAIIRKAERAAKKAGTDITAAIVSALQAELGWSEKLATEAAEPDFAGRRGFAPYSFSNGSAEARRIKQRIAQLEARAAVPETELVFGDVRVLLADNRVQIHFPGKPDEALRNELKRNGFKWAPSVGAWQRMPSQWAWDIAKRLAARSAS